MNRFTVTIERTEIISYVVEAADADEAEDIYMGEGDETASRTKNITVLSVEPTS